MKKRLVLFIILFVNTSLLISQDLYELRNAIDFYKTQKFFKDDWKDILSENDIKGSPYLNDEFINGSLFTTSKLHFVDLPLRFNIFNDQMEFKTESNQIQAIANPDIVFQIELDSNKIVYLSFSTEKKIKKGFFIVLESGNVSLYAKPEVEFVKPTLPVPFKDAEPAKFIRKQDKYFIKIANEHAKLVVKAKDFIDIMPDKKAYIEEYIKTNKVKINNPEKLNALVKYMNTL